ncbi:SRPBCC family protein [Actinoplanes sp. NPDC049802]|uniref:SRPBCC family protein n=1 Tax=Actinoplanes sp. NPDC049802 TaxID=3154742 RepID=UPI00340E3E1D
MRFDVDTRATPEQVRRAFTEFGDRRPQIWSRTLDPKKYELREQGDTWAVARESTAGSPFWVVARYDWSDPEVIRWTVVESSYGGGGDGHVRITPGPGGGSRLHAEWTNTGARVLQRPLLFLLHLRPMARMLSRMYTTTLDRFAEQDRQ